MDHRAILSPLFSYLLGVYSLSVSIYKLCMYVCMAITYSKGKDQSGKVANPARGLPPELSTCHLIPLVGVGKRASH